MKKRRLLTVLVMAAAIACTMSACGFGDKEDDSQIVVETEVTPTPEAEPTPTIAANVQTTTYISANRMISIDLPDATWSVKYDEEEMWSFESPSAGKILIIYGTEDDLASTVLPNTEDMAVSLEAAAGMEHETDRPAAAFSTWHRGCRSLRLGNAQGERLIKSLSVPIRILQRKENKWAEIKRFQPI